MKDKDVRVAEVKSTGIARKPNKNLNFNVANTTSVIAVIHNKEM